MRGDTLILGLAAGYHYGDVRPFLASLEHTGHTSETVLFTSGTTRDLDRMRAHRVTIIPYTRPAGLADMPCNGLRYFLYRDYLRALPRPCSRVLITDVRDVLFQRDPFGHPWPDGLNAMLEDRRATVGSCPFNARWVREHLGADALAAIGGCPISCSGTTVADHAAMLDYLDKMTELLDPPTTGECMAGYDQGIHNYLIHTGRVAAALHDNDGPVLTLAQTRGEPRMDADGRVLNEAGRPAHIVHQYDRKPSLFQHIRHRFAPANRAAVS
ncbi:MAG: hypothetical protein H0S80_08180 [Desulfovibrionaceae bacterium]|nr:hypothetical protein [Desulfovibrionaceae bacterium]